MDNAHEAIIDKETWEKVNERIATKRVHGRGRKIGRNPLSGKLYCACCGGVLWFRANRNKHKEDYEYWYCSTHMGRGTGCEEPVRIATKTIRGILSQLTDGFEPNREHIKNDLITFAQEYAKSLSDNDGVDTLTEIKRLESRKKRLTEAYLDEIITKEEFKERNAEIETSLESLKAELEKVENNDELREVESLIDNIDSELDEWFNADLKDHMVDFLIEHIQRITITSKNHLIVEMDLIAGAIILGEDYLLYVQESK